MIAISLKKHTSTKNEKVSCTNCILRKPVTNTWGKKGFLEIEIHVASSQSAKT